MARGKGGGFDDSQEAQFDGSVDLLIRLNINLHQINTYRECNNAFQWLKHLKTYYAEIFPLLTSEEVVIAAGLMKEAQKGVGNLQPHILMTAETYDTLWNLELELRRLHHKHGLYTRLLEKRDLGRSLLE